MRLGDGRGKRSNHKSSGRPELFGESFRVLRENGIGAGEKTKAQALASGFDSEQKNT
jgi:hypothetical protein